MKLRLENIGKIKKTSIEVNSITVIAGENNSGKSTIGKSLFSIFNSMYNYQNIITKDKKDNIYELVLEYLNNMYTADGRISFFRLREFILENVSQQIDSLIEEKDSDSLVRLIDGKINDYLEDEYNVFVNEEQKKELLTDLNTSIDKILNVSNDAILKKIISNNLMDEFNNQINNIYSETGKIASIKLDVKEDTSEIIVENDTVIDVKNPKLLNTRAVYLDDPNILDDLRLLRSRSRRGNFNHRDYLNELLLTDINSDSKENLTKQVLIDEKLEDIFEKINPIVPGRITRKKFDIGYQEADMPDSLNVRNLSSGLKTFVIIKTLLMNGSLEENGTMILDEPEIHLHPEWQVVLAELIVLIQKEFNMHILLATHSPYFLYALEVFAEKHDILATTKFYKSKNKKDKFYFDDVTDNVEVIYAQLARPFQKLENIRYE